MLWVYDSASLYVALVQPMVHKNWCAKKDLALGTALLPPDSRSPLFVLAALLFCHIGGQAGIPQSETSRLQLLAKGNRRVPLRVEVLFPSQRHITLGLIEADGAAIRAIHMQPED